MSSAPDRCTLHWAQGGQPSGCWSSPWWSPGRRVPAGEPGAPSEWPRDGFRTRGWTRSARTRRPSTSAGRAQAAELTRWLHASAIRPADRFLMLTGASGSGKSSLVRAGVMPRLRRRWWTIVPASSPGPNPLHAMAASLAVAAVAGRPPTRYCGGCGRGRRVWRPSCRGCGPGSSSECCSACARLRRRQPAGVRCELFRRLPLST
ncbi:nSTAND1 domain-containing NTPase [Streptomyces viridiviolaceus]